jgi:PAS domain S-box-containing protein
VNDQVGFVSGQHPLGELMAATMQAVLGASSDAVITLDADSKIVVFNPAAERLFGVSAAEAIGGAISRFIPARYREAHERFVRQFRLIGETSRQMGASRPISGLRADGEEFPMEAWISRAQVGDDTFLTVVLRDISDRQLVEDARVQMLIAREVEHRAKNALAAVQALVRDTPAATKKDLVRVLRGRIAAFARGYSLLVTSAWQSVDLRRLLDTELHACAAPTQTRVNGPKVQIAPEAVQPLSLVLHELTTNALKYGALSREGGVVDLSWKIAPGPMLQLTWRETGGPTIAEPPSAKGFGSALLDELLVGQLKGRLALDWRREGLVAVLTVPPPAFHEDGPAPGKEPSRV